MYICICNAICDKKINQAIDCGHKKVKDVYSACGAKPQCGTCANDIKSMIQDREEMQLAAAD